VSFYIYWTYIFPVSDASDITLLQRGIIRTA